MGARGSTQLCSACTFKVSWPSEVYEGLRAPKDAINHPLRGRLHLRFGCAVWMCSKPSAAMTCVFDVQQIVRPITLNAANIAASRAA
jgi:hypothetical protein